MGTMATAATSPPDEIRSPGLTLGRLFDLAYEWMERARQRQSLAGLDDRMLRDIGLGRGEIAREIEKPFWQY